MTGAKYYYGLVYRNMTLYLLKIITLKRCLDWDVRYHNKHITDSTVATKYGNDLSL